MTSDMRALRTHSKKIRSEYELHLSKHDPNSPEAAHWVGKDKTWLRSRILTEVDELGGMRLLDFGCGNGLLVDFLNENGCQCEYYGWDISDAMIEVAKKRHPEVTFSVVDILKDDITRFSGFFDYVLASGVFYIKTRNTRSELHKKWIETILARLWPLCSKGIAVNFLTEYVQWRDKELYYCPIGDIVEFCTKKLSRSFVVRHDYELWEFTLYVYKGTRLPL
jgi:SAM-dependent methyltransferase